MATVPKDCHYQGTSHNECHYVSQKECHYKLQFSSPQPYSRFSEEWLTLHSTVYINCPSPCDFTFGGGHLPNIYSSKYPNHKRHSHIPNPFERLPFCTLECLLQLAYRFAISRKKRNQWMHATNGNTSCNICHCDLYPKIFPKHNRRFNKQAVQLPNGMMVHHHHYCQDRLSVWFYRKGIKQYQVYYNQKAKHLHSHILAARAASGKPGDHDTSKKLLAPFFAIHNYSNRVQLDHSGRESRSASGALITHQNLRSADARLHRHLAFVNHRRKSRREYRQ